MDYVSKGNGPIYFPISKYGRVKAEERSEGGAE